MPTPSFQLTITLLDSWGPRLKETAHLEVFVSKISKRSCRCCFSKLWFFTLQHTIHIKRQDDTVWFPQHAECQELDVTTEGWFFLCVISKHQLLCSWKRLKIETVRCDTAISDWEETSSSVVGGRNKKAFHESGPADLTGLFAASARHQSSDDDADTQHRVLPLWISAGQLSTWIK